MTKEIEIINEGNIKSKIYTIRGLQVMLDRDLAELYEVETKVFNQAVKKILYCQKPYYIILYYRLTYGVSNAI
jgi:hypothetical protein